MKFILAQPANLRFQWELEVALTNIRSLDKTTPIIVLFLEESAGVVSYIQEKYKNQSVSVYSYSDGREDKSYVPTIRPYLMWRYLSEDVSREKEVYFQIDADVIFREMPDWSKFSLKGQKCVASDCSGYIDYDYISTRKNGDYILKMFSEILNISEKLIKDTPGGGAQWIITNPTAQLWWHIWRDSDLLYDFLEPLDSDIQKWTAEMWAQLYNLAKFGWEIETSTELDFCRPTDDIKMWKMTKILHNAGVIGVSASALFYKGSYIDKTPFDEDFSWVRRDKASKKYVEAIEKVLQ